MQIPDAELGTVDVDWQEHSAASAQVLDVAVTAVFGSPGNGSRAFFPYLHLDLIRRTASMDVLWFRGRCDETIQGAGTDQFTFSAIPFSEDFCRRRTPQDARVNQAWESYMRNMARRAEYAFKVPDRFGAIINTVSVVNGPHCHHNTVDTCALG